MEYTRSVGDDYETFKGTSEEIFWLVKSLDEKTVRKVSFGSKLSVSIDGKEIAERVMEKISESIKPKLIEQKRVYEKIGVPGKNITKNVGLPTCSCGDEDCQLFMLERG